MTTSTARRAELAAFLRSRRARVAPEDLGLPPGPRRRTPGLRREELALHAGVGVTWYTWLEQGRPINASPQVLDAIGRTLGLDHPELSHLYQLAEVRGAPEPPPCGELEPTVQQILDDFGSFPACVVNSRMDALAWNEPYRALWPRTRHSKGHNLLWWSFTVPECCSSIVDRELELPLLAANFRAHYVRHLGDPAWEGLVEALLEASPEFVEIWARHDVAAHATRTKVYRHPAVGEVSVVISGFVPASAPDTKLIVYTPADGPSQERLRWLIAHPEAPFTDHVH